MIALVIVLMLVDIKGYKLALGYSTGNSIYFCLPIIVKGQTIKVGHLGGRSAMEYHYLPIHPSYANSVCKLDGIE